MIGLIFFGSIVLFAGFTVWMVRLSFRAKTPRGKAGFLILALLPMGEFSLNLALREWVKSSYQEVDEEEIARWIGSHGIRGKVELLRLPIASVDLPSVEGELDYFEAVKRLVWSGKADRLEVFLWDGNRFGRFRGTYVIEYREAGCEYPERGCFSEDGVVLKLVPGDRTSPSHGGSEAVVGNCTAGRVVLYDYEVCDRVTFESHGRGLLEYERVLQFTHAFTNVVSHMINPVSKDRIGLSFSTLAKVNWLTEDTQSLDYGAFSRALVQGDR